MCRVTESIYVLLGQVVGAMSLINSSQNYRLTQYNLEDLNFTLFISRISPHSPSQIQHGICTRINYELYKIISKTSLFSKFMCSD